MNTVRKIFASALVLATIVSVSGINLAKAAAMDGDLIKMNGLSTVYYYKGGKRYVFPQQNTYMSWFTNFNNVRVVSQSELESYPLGANVTMRPGTTLIKITTNPTVYAVEPGGKLRSIVSEANASSLWGANWAKKVVDVSDAFFTNYQITSALTAGVYPAGSLVKGTSADVYYFDGTNFRKFGSESAFYANKFNFAFVQTAPSSMTMTPLGSDITGLESGLTDLSYGAGGTVGGSGLSVALSSDTPASANIPTQATHVVFTKFNVTAANDGDVTLQTVGVKRSGLGLAGDIDSVYLYDGMTRLTSGRGINSSTNMATFNNVNFTIPKGTTKTLSIVADITSATAGSHMFSIALASDIVANNATVSGSFPVTGNTMSITSVPGGVVTVARNGAPTNPRAGDIGAKIAGFSLTDSSVEDLTVNSITLYQIGNISTGNLTNFVLKQASTTVATTASMGSNGYITLNFTTPFVLAKGDSRNFDLYADVSALARAGDTSTIYLENKADVNTVGNTYGFGAGVSNSYTSSSTSAVVIQASQVTFSFQGPSATNYAVQQKAVELLRFNAVSQPNIEIRSTVIRLDSVGSNLLAHYTNIKLVDATTGTLLAGPKDSSAAATTQDLTFSDTWNVNAGQTRTVKVIADIANSTAAPLFPAATETIKATLVRFAASTIKNLDTNQYVLQADVVPSSNIAGPAHNVKSGSLTASLAGTPSAKNIINGSAGVPMTGINLTAGTGKDVTVTSVKVTAVGAVSCLAAADCVSSVKLFDGPNQIGTTQSLSSSTSTFSNLSVSIAKGTTKTLTVKSDLLTLGTVTGGTTLKFNVAATETDIVAQDPDGNSVTLNTSVLTGPTMPIVTAGSMTVGVAPSELATEEKIVVAGTNDQILGKFKFNAVNEDLSVTKVRVEIPTGAATLSSVNQLALFNDSGTNLTGYVTLTSGTPNYVDFNINTATPFVVLKDSSAVLTVKANLNTISNGGVSGTTITATLSDDAGTFEARGLNGSNTVLVNNTGWGVVAGQNMYLYKTKPTITNVALPNTLLTAGQNTMAKVSITADAAGVVDWRELTFTVATNNIGSLATPVLVDENNASVATCTPDPVVSTVTCTNAAADNQVAAGQTKTYSLKMDVTLAANTNPASVSTRIGLVASAVVTSDYTTLTGAGTGAVAKFIWSDESVGHVIGSTDYHNEWKVKNIPTDSQTLSK